MTRVARLLVRLATLLAGGECQCGFCVRQRALEARAGRMAELLPRRERREIHRGAWRYGQRR